MLVRCLTTTVVAMTLLVCAGCDSTVTESDLQKWTNNDRGLERISQVVADPEQPLDTKIRALEVVVEKGFEARVRTMIDGISSAEERSQLAEKLSEQLTKHLVNKSKYQLDAKDGLMTLDRYLSKEAWEPIQKAVATWAFSDISWATDATEVRTKIESRIFSGQTMELGKYGWDAAGILISHGYVVDKMVRYLGSANDPVATETLLKGFRKLHSTTGPQAYHVEALQNTASAAGAAYLLEMYFNENIDEEFRGHAFNAAVDMTEKVEKWGDATAVEKWLLKLINQDAPADRWLGAANLVRVSGATKLDKVFEGLKDDRVYDKAEEDPAKSVMDLCLDVYDGGHAAAANPVFVKQLTTGNRIGKSVAIVCLKANQGTGGTAQLKTIAATSAMGTDTSVDDFLGEQLTLGRLAQNALDAFPIYAEIAAAEKAGKLTKEQAKTKRELTTFDLELTGAPYKAAIEARYKAWLADQAPAPDGAAAPDKKPDTAAGTAKPPGAAPATAATGTAPK